VNAVAATLGSPSDPGVWTCVTLLDRITEAHLFEHPMASTMAASFVKAMEHSAPRWPLSATTVAASAEMTSRNRT